MSIRVLIADDQALVRAGFRMILEADADMNVVAEAEDGATALREAIRMRPDVVLMDIRMPVMDGLEATRRIMASRQPPRVLILTTFDQDEYVFDALAAGASGFLLKDVAPEELLAALRVIIRGDSLLSPAVTRALIEAFVRDHPQTSRLPAGFDQLTTREAEIFRLIARGHSNADIADQLTVSSTTVKTHVAHILDKLALRDRVQAVVLAYESGIIRPGEMT